VAFRVQAFLYLGRLRLAERAAGLTGLFQDLGWEGDRARCLLLQAEIARRQHDAVAFSQHLEAGARWTLHSGSVEHLCLYHLVRGRAACAAGELGAAQRAVGEGIHVASHCGLGLYLVELRCLQAEISLGQGAGGPAAEQAGAALEHALAPDCQFLWGAAEAAHLLGQALMTEQVFERAQPALQLALDLRRQIGHPRLAETKRLLGEVP
jgi:hypothetical protein